MVLPPGPGCRPPEPPARPHNPNQNKMPLVSGTRGARLRDTTHVRPSMTGLCRSAAAPAVSLGLPEERRLITRAPRPRLLGRPRVRTRTRPAVRPAAPEPCSVRRPRRLAPTAAGSLSPPACGPGSAGGPTPAPSSLLCLLYGELSRLVNGAGVG